MAARDLSNEEVSVDGRPEIKGTADYSEDKPRALKLDKHGLPLVPQPSDHPDDPLNWPQWMKLYVVGLLCALGFVCILSGSLANPTFVPMAKDLGVTVQQASYTTTVFVLITGLTPMALTPFANVYGRRILYLIMVLLAAASNLGSGAAKTYGGLIVGRLFCGIGASLPLGLGAATICDLFTQGERGLYMGIYVLAVNNGPHIAPIIGGYVAETLSWRWCFYIIGIIQGGLWVICIFTLPETLYSRTDFSKLERKSYMSKLLFHGKVLDRKITLASFAAPFKVIKYWAVLLPSIYYMTATAYGTLVFALVGASVASEYYNFNTGQTGLLMGVPLTIGCMLGEASAGWLSDVIINNYASRHGGYRKPEARLYLVPLGIVMNAGIIIFGVCVQDHTPWIGLAVAMGMAGFGLQISSTMTYTYSTDSYKPQASEVAAVINLFRFVFAFNVGFYALPFSHNTSFGIAFGVFSAIQFATTLPVIYLIFKGESIREKQGVPIIHQDL